MIEYYATTIVKPAGSDHPSIPEYKFEFVPFEHLRGRCDKNVHLTGIDAYKFCYLTLYSYNWKVWLKEKIKLYVLDVFDHVNYVDVIGKVSIISLLYEKDKNGKPSKRRIIEIEDKRFVRLKWFFNANNRKFIK